MIVVTGNGRFSTHSGGVPGGGGSASERCARNAPPSTHSNLVHALPPTGCPGPTLAAPPPPPARPAAGARDSPPFPASTAPLASIRCPPIETPDETPELPPRRTGAGETLGAARRPKCPTV